MNEIIELTKKELATKEGLVKSYFTALNMLVYTTFLLQRIKWRKFLKY